MTDIYKPFADKPVSGLTLLFRDVMEMMRPETLVDYRLTDGPLMFCDGKRWVFGAPSVLHGDVPEFIPLTDGRTLQELPRDLRDPFCQFQEMGEEEERWHCCAGYSDGSYVLFIRVPRIRLLWNATGGRRAVLAGPMESRYIDA